MDSDSDWSDPDNPRPKKPAPRRTFYQEPKLPKGATLHMSFCFYHGLLGKLLEDGSYSDFTIRCGDREWKVHKAIVCSQSDIFDTAINGKFRVCICPPDIQRVSTDIYLGGFFLG